MIASTAGRPYGSDSACHESDDTYTTAAGLDQLCRHHALDDGEKVAPGALEGKVEVRLVEHHANVGSGPSNCRAASDKTTGWHLSSRGRSARTEGGPPRAPPARREPGASLDRGPNRSGSSRNRSGSMVCVVRVTFNVWRPHLDRFSRRHQLSGEQCRIVPDTAAFGWILAGQDDARSCETSRLQHALERVRDVRRR